MNTKIPKYLYHSTFMQNLKSIFKYGLTPDNNQRKNYSLSHDGVIYLSDSISDSQYYCIIKQCGRNLPPYNIITLIIDTSNLNMQLFQQDVKHKEAGQWKCSHYMYSGIIHPSAIVEIKTYVNDDKLIKQQLLKQAKQVGVLYHYTSIYNLYQILIDDCMRATNWSYRSSQTDFNKYNNSPKEEQVACFTRNRNFHNVSDIGKTSVRIVIDGNKLSNNYKIKPMRDVAHIGYTKHISDQSQQVCIGNIENIKKYIIRIDIDYNVSLFHIYHRYSKISTRSSFEISYKLCKVIFNKVVKLLEKNKIPYQFTQFIKNPAYFSNCNLSYKKFLELSQKL